MSTGSPVPSLPGSPDLVQLSARVDELSRQALALSDALERSKKSRRIIMVAFLAFVILAGWRFYALAITITSPDYQARLLAELQKSVSANQDIFSREAEKFVEAVTPVVTKAVSDQTSKDMPLFMKIVDDERKHLLENLPKTLTDKVEKQHHFLLMKHQKLVEDQFPSAKDPKVRDRMMENACVALDRLVQKYYVEELTKELKAMSTFWDDFPPAATAEKGEAELDQQLIGELMELVALKLSRNKSLAAP